jgi:hypothetical protein
VAKVKLPALAGTSIGLATLRFASLLFPGNSVEALMHVQGKGGDTEFLAHTFWLVTEFQVSVLGQLSNTWSRMLVCTVHYLHDTGCAGSSAINHIHVYAVVREGCNAFELLQYLTHKISALLPCRHQNRERACQCMGIWMMNSLKHKTASDVCVECEPKRQHT